MDTYEKSIVAFLDILGFKNIVNTGTFDEVLQIFDSIITKNDAVKALHRVVDEKDDSPSGEAIVRYNEALEDTKIHIMSDSIVIATPVMYPESLAVIVDICDVIQQLLFELENPVLLRGAIAEGDFFLNDRLLFGKGLVDAYWAQEKYAVYPRIILSNEITIGKRVFLNGVSELPKDEDGYYYINSIERYLGIDEEWNKIIETEQYDKIKNLVDTNLNGYNEDRVRQKYLWIKKELERISERGYCTILAKV